METRSRELKMHFWEGQPVPMADIEQELNRLWSEAYGGTGSALVRVRNYVLNLAVVTGSRAEAEHVSAVVGQLSGRHPLRAVILSAEPDHRTSSLDTYITAYSSEDPLSHSLTACEQVIVGVQGEPAQHLAGVAARLLIPDLPVYLWWVGSPDFKSESFQSLVRISRKLIIDSAGFAQDSSALTELLHMSRNRRLDCSVNDLNWIRLWSWFEVIAQFFDDPSLRPYLYNIRALRLEHSAKEGREPNCAQAGLLAAWVLSRVGKSPDCVSMERADHPELKHGDLVSFSMESEADGHAARFNISYLPDSTLYASSTVHIDGQAVHERIVMLRRRSLPDMLDLALEDTHRDVPYEESLATAASLLGGSNAE